MVSYPPTLPEAGRRVRVHFVYHLPEVIVRRNALLVKSQTGKCQVWGGGGRGCSDRCSHNEIYDIGTEILLLTKNDLNSTQKAPKSIIPEDFKSAGHSPSSDSVKSRFKAIFKKWPSWIRICCFSWIFAPGGRLNHEAYNVRTIYKHKS